LFKRDDDDFDPTDESWEERRAAERDEEDDVGECFAFCLALEGELEG
tara:strand:+ start:380 stop:520 length:141 start_codon:yes stop_codon:yes gene_type:complete